MNAEGLVEKIRNLLKKSEKYFEKSLHFSVIGVILLNTDPQGDRVVIWDPLTNLSVVSEKKEAREAEKHEEPQPQITQKELTELRTELLSLQRRKEALERQYYGLQMRIAGQFGKGIVDPDSSLAVESEYLKFYQELEEKSLAAAESMDRVNFLFRRVIVEGMPESDSEVAGILKVLEESHTRAHALKQFARPAETPSSAGKWLVLDVNAELKLAVISAGFKQGVRSGMVLWSGKERLIELRVIEVRPDVSACMIVQGEVGAIEPGMEASAGQTKQTE